MSRDRLGIIGSGDVGRTLARGFARHGWRVKLGTRTPEDLETWLAETMETVSVGQFDAAASFSDETVLAVRGSAAEEAIDLANPDSLAGDLLLDATNPLDFSPDGPPRLLFGGRDSLGERIQEQLPETRVVKCFNTVSHLQMVDPDFEAETPPMFVCGNDDGAKARTESMLVDLGWPGAFDVGDIEAARYLEAMFPLWVRAGIRLDTMRHAFAVVE